MSVSKIKIGDTQFKVKAKLGEGTYGSVYKVKYGEGREENEYALKYIQSSAREGIISLRELDIMSRLRHPHLMHAEKIFCHYDISNSLKTKQDNNKTKQKDKEEDKSSTLGILMPLASGGDMYKANFDKEFTLKERFTVLYQISHAVNFLHQNGYLHLDIKPMNILLFESKNKKDFGKLTDFGLSLMMEKKKMGIGNDYKRGKYFPLKIVTVDHRAPEIMDGDFFYTDASDVWALGITFLETLSYGNPIFKKANGAYFTDDDYTEENVRKVYDEKLIPSRIRNTLVSSLKLASLSPSLKNKVYDIIERMLDFNPNTRATIDDVLHFFTSLNNDLIESKDINIPEGMSFNPKISPSKLDPEMVKLGFDRMNEVASRIQLSTETLFLAGDIYQRTLIFSHAKGEHGKQKEDKEQKEKNEKNIIFSAIVSLYLAIKMLESFFDDSKTLTELARNLFPHEYIMLGESIIVPALNGIIYPDNLFVLSVTYNRLLKAYTLLPDNKVYPFIDLAEWYNLSEEEAKTEGRFNKYIPYRDFISMF